MAKKLAVLSYRLTEDLNNKCEWHPEKMPKIPIRNSKVVNTKDTKASDLDTLQKLASSSTSSGSSSSAGIKAGETASEGVASVVAAPENSTDVATNSKKVPTACKSVDGSEEFYFEVQK